MWASQRGIAYARRHVFRRASAMEVIAIQIPLCTYEICRKGAFAGDPSEEVDELIWSSFGELFSMYKRGEIELIGIMGLFYAWQGRFDYLGWNRIAPSLPSDSLRAKLAFLCGCHMKRQTNNEIATKFFRDALKNAVGNDDLNRIINAEAKELSK